jgi:hypothetical protein
MNTTTNMGKVEAPTCNKQWHQHKNGISTNVRITPPTRKKTTMFIKTNLKKS